MKKEKCIIGLAAFGLAALSPALLAQATNATTNAVPLIIPLGTALSATTISGYVDTSAVWNPGTGNANPAPYAFNAGKQDGFNLNAVDVKIAKAEDETSWAAGYVVELSYGPDATAIDGGAAPIRQAYVELKMPIGNGIDWQLGRWDNLLGYESSDSYKNPNYTRSYAYTFEPTEHTGLLGSYKVCDALNLEAGVADTVTTLGLNSRSDPGSPVIESKKAFVSLVTLTAPDSWGAFKGSVLYAGFDYGDGNSGANITGTTGHDRNEWYVGATLNTPVTNLTFGVSWDWIHHFDVQYYDNTLATTATYDAQYVDSVAGYASYKITDKLTINGRAEYANGPGLEGLLYADNGQPNGAETPTKFDKVLALTGTLQYDLWANVITRVEVRWDHAADGAAAFGGDGTVGSGAAPEKKNELMIGANVIYKF
jgi:Putative beta-barrel porin-2, OmpL-like. bbp2